MSNGIKIGLLAVIAAALGILAWKALSGNNEVVKSRSATEANSDPNDKGSLQNPKPNTFYPTNGTDPLANGQITPPPTNAKSATDVGKESEARTKTNIKWDQTVHDFGNLKQGDKGEYTFKFTNVGTEPLVIENCKAGCGCTVPQWPKEPIVPGGKGEIQVTYNSAGKQGPQTKDVTVTANTNPIQSKLTIKANVDAGAGGAATPSKH
ncbi:MAG: hypothetical protein RL220_196 [Bacteroidota bacterium]